MSRRGLFSMLASSAVAPALSARRAHAPEGAMVLTVAAPLVQHEALGRDIAARIAEALNLPEDSIGVTFQDLGRCRRILLEVDLAAAAPACPGAGIEAPGSVPEAWPA